MGSCVDSVIVQGDDLSVKDIKTKFQDIQEADRHVNGHSYSGTFGMCEGLKQGLATVDTYEEASEYLEENTDKWEAAAAVRYKGSKGGLFTMVGGWCSE